jgi:glycosyltransferase involved in cell wall biosynthesis
MSRLDILLPHYQDIEGLELSLASIARQTWTGDMRIIIVDDGSPSEVFAGVEALAAKQELPVLLERNKRNRGRPFTRNRLLGLSDSDYIAWLDAGDVWYPEKLARQFEHLARLRFEGEDVSRIWITCNYDWQWAGRRARHTTQEVSSDQVKELMLGAKLRAYLWTLLGTAEAFRSVGPFDEELPRLQDLDYFIRFARGGGILSAPPGREALCRYFKSDVGRDADEIRRCNRRIFDKYRSSFEGYGRGFVSQIRYNAETLSARYAKNNGAELTRGWYMARAFAASPRRTLGMTKRWLASGGDK